MGKPTGFMEYERLDRSYKPAGDRVQHFREFVIPLDESELSNQGARCMDCGIPFCHKGCPVDNLIPEWNALVFNNDWRRAFAQLDSTNNFPEFTGRLCPAPCEDACTLTLADRPVTIKSVELAIAERAWQSGWIQPQIAGHKTGKRVAVVGSGPAGLACAQQLARTGYRVMVMEKADRIGGLLRYGIPDFRLEKSLLERRLEQLRAEGVLFVTGLNAGVDADAARWLAEQK